MQHKVHACRRYMINTAQSMWWKCTMLLRRAASPYKNVPAVDAENQKLLLCCSFAFSSYECWLPSADCQLSFNFSTRSLAKVTSCIVVFHADLALVVLIIIRLTQLISGHLQVPWRSYWLLRSILLHTRIRYDTASRL